MTAEKASGNTPTAGAPVPSKPSLGIARFCEIADRLNEMTGWLFGPGIALVAAAIIYEVVLRGAFNSSTIWVSEAGVYGSSVIYLLAGGYALLHRRHVRIDLLATTLSPRAGIWMDIAVFPFLLLYAGALIVVGGDLAWASFRQSEGTGTPWNPAIWPVKFCIPIAGFLLLIQAFSNLFRDIGWCHPPSAPSADAGCERDGRNESGGGAPGPRS